ncbi:fumarylacetoacetate hydrolase family protein [Paenibacillus sp. GCM10023248]|uniref:fumarylacetoacetate hydrolase family protein n=1 Tax=Bacillales TaxID=1385 RepID=UPI002379E2F2|nr:MULTISPECIES: fumarylacetoacetate hydrolase family protein [Bacillales]MDD9269121.1 fumarylacetoacetate hydrolase family protein [Paenibacillus sp. MAHUQ-63]MDR6880658.1 2-dehydro-3-deoxy-D-arabinonate dehydratase [Bacillus sp. 3255]
MRIIRYANEGVAQLAAVTDNEEIYLLPQRDYLALVHEAAERGISPLQLVNETASNSKALSSSLEQLQLLVPIEAPEVWAAGVTYERSRDARNYEATEGRLDATTFYDKVYDAVRPEIFFKSTAARTVGPGGDVQLRSDSVWQVPEPELGLVLSASGQLIGYTAGNDMSCRDIEGENPLYLPQAKMWKRSCSLGPAIRLPETVEDPYNLQITSRIYRNGEQVVEGTANTGQLKRKLEELIQFLIRDNELFDGTVLLTGTCIVPPNEFTLAPGDRIEINIAGIGTLINHVVDAGQSS